MPAITYATKSADHIHVPAVPHCTFQFQEKDYPLLPSKCKKSLTSSLTVPTNTLTATVPTATRLTATDSTTPNHGPDLTTCDIANPDISARISTPGLTTVPKTLPIAPKTVLSKLLSISASGGGSSEYSTDSEVNIIVVRKNLSLREIMDFPNTFHEPNFNIVKINSKIPFIDNIRAGKFGSINYVPTIPDCEKMLALLESRGNSYMVETSIGRFTDTSLKQILSWKYNIYAKSDILCEQEWLDSIESGHIRTPMGIDNTGNIVFARNAIEYLHNRANENYKNLDFASVRGLVCSNWLTDDFLIHIANKINTTYPDAYTFYYEPYNESHDILDEVITYFFNNKKEGLKKLVIFCRVVEVNNNELNGVFIGGYYDRVADTHYVGNHYVLLVFDIEMKTVTYCDSKGKKAPSGLKVFIEKINQSFFSGCYKFTICLAHFPNNVLPGSSAPHTCEEKNCAPFFPLQTCSSACGIAVVMCAILATGDIARFRNLCSKSSNIVSPEIRFLRNISIYSDFLRLVLLKWLFIDTFCLDDIFSKKQVPPSNISNVANKNNNFVKSNKENVKPMVTKDTINKKAGKYKESINVIGKDSEESRKRKTNAHNTNLSSEVSQILDNIICNVLKNVNEDTVPSNKVSELFFLPSGYFETGESKTDAIAQYSLYSNYDLRCVVDICEMGTSEHYHCKLCDLKVFLPKKFPDHLFSCHLKSKVCAENTVGFSVPCRNYEGCKTNAEKRSHYHCLFCTSLIKTQGRFIEHAKSHRKKDNTAACSKSNENQDKYQINATNINHENIEHIESHIENDNAAICSKSNGNQDIYHKNDNVNIKSDNITCDVCGFILLKKNLSTHKQRKHNQLEKKSICVDKERAIYMVSKNTKGPRFPCHVQKLIIGEGEKAVSCEVKNCEKLMQISAISDKKSIECRHLKCVSLQLSSFKGVDKPVILDEHVLYTLGVNGAKKYSDTSLNKGMALNYAAKSNNIIPVVQFSDNRYVHLSIFCNKKHNLSKINRVIVSFDSNHNTMSCECVSNMNWFCVHKVIAFWYLTQTKQVTTFSTIDDFPEVRESTLKGDKEQKSFIEKDTEDNEILKKMVKYIHIHKKYSTDALKRFSSVNVNEIPKNIIPSETTCIECSQPLSPPNLKIKNAYILTIQGYFPGYQVYNKKCSSCNMIYRYQDDIHGIHNYDDNLFLGFDLCAMIKKELQLNHSISSKIMILNSLHGCKVDEKKAADAYFLFDILSTQSYDFYCIQCGYHPKILVMDVQRKIAYRFPNENLDIDSSCERKREVDSDLFWNNVELQILARGFSKSELFPVELSLNNWSPYMGLQTRKSNYLFNTEFEKDSIDKNEVESDTTELTDERIVELMTNSTLSTVRSVAKDCRVSLKGRKEEVIKNIKKAMLKDNSSFNKVFTKIKGHSGGWLTFSCIHGVCYYVKFINRSESPRDYVDGLLSMKHIPNVNIVDMAHIVARHGNGPGRREDVRSSGHGNEDGLLFYPNGGRVGNENNHEILQNAMEGTFVKSFPWLNDQKNAKDIEQEAPCIHPITGSNSHYCLFDVFHEGNTTVEGEVLRQIKCVKELRGIINTNVAEQGFAKQESSKSFLNLMKPVKHIYLLRSIINNCNIGINNMFIKMITEEYEGELSRDKFGRCILASPVKNHNNVANESPTSNFDELNTLPSSFSQNCIDFEVHHDTAKRKSSISCNTNNSLDETISYGNENDDHSSILNASSNDMWIPSLGLRQATKYFIQSGAPLTDDIVNAGLARIRGRQNSSIDGLNDVQKRKDHTEKLFSNIKPNFVQILKSSESHYITVTDIDFASIRMIGRQKAQLSIMDGYHSSSYRKDDGVYRYSFSVIQDCAELLASSSKSHNCINFKIESVIQADSHHDSGILALFYAHHLNKMNDPTLVSLESEDIRENFISFLETGEWHCMTPIDKNGNKCITEFSLQTYCTCNQPSYEQGNNNCMVECSNCAAWFHWWCAEYTSRDGNVTWYCHKCNIQQSKHTLKEQKLPIENIGQAESSRKRKKIETASNPLFNNDESNNIISIADCPNIVLQEKSLCLDKVFFDRLFEKELHKKICYVESKSNFADLFSAILIACRWLLDNHTSFVVKPTLPQIMSANDDFLQQVYSFFTHGDLVDDFGDDLERRQSAYEYLQDSSAFKFENMDDMTLFLDEMHRLDNHVSTIGPQRIFPPT